MRFPWMALCCSTPKMMKRRDKYSVSSSCWMARLHNAIWIFFPRLPFVLNNSPIVFFCLFYLFVYKCCLLRLQQCKHINFLFFSFHLLLVCMQPGIVSFASVTTKIHAFFFQQQWLFPYVVIHSSLIFCPDSAKSFFKLTTTFLL